MEIEEHIQWQDYFMGIAIISAYRSKDKNTKVGSCIIKDNKIIGVGYNGMPMCDKNDDVFPWEKDEDVFKTKYSYVVHSELNAIFNCNIKDLKEAVLYVTLFPCNECAKAIVQVGIKKIYYLEDKYEDKDFSKIAKIIFEKANVLYEKYTPQILIDIRKV